MQSPSWDVNLDLLRSHYAVINELTDKLGLILEHGKSKLFHFSRKHRDDNPSLDLGVAPFTGDSPLKPKEIWRYLGFFFDRRLSFNAHVRFYATTSLTSVKAMKMLGNSSRRLLPAQKQTLYRTCVLPIATYGYQLWYFKGAKCKGALRHYKQMQR